MVEIPCSPLFVMFYIHKKFEQLHVYILISPFLLTMIVTFYVLSHINSMVFNSSLQILAIKIGRRSYKAQVHAIEEILRLELQQKIKHDGSLASKSEHNIEMDRIVKILTDTHMNDVPNTAEFFNTISEREERYMVSYDQ